VELSSRSKSQKQKRQRKQPSNLDLSSDSSDDDKDMNLYQEHSFSWYVKNIIDAIDLSVVIGDRAIENYEELILVTMRIYDTKTSLSAIREVLDEVSEFHMVPANHAELDELVPMRTIDLDRVADDISEFSSSDGDSDESESSSSSEDSEEEEEEEKKEAASTVSANPFPGYDWCMRTPSKEEMKIYLRRQKQVEFLQGLSQPEQRTPEWYAARGKAVTASDGAVVLGKDHYKRPYQFILKKCGIEDFTDSAATHHGKKYESIAAQIYVQRANVKVKFFGLISHPKGIKVAASPDGICSHERFDAKDRSVCPLVGRMLEIKCVLSREINSQGKLNGDQCPHHYWIQVQMQLECCDLDECDFWQCKLVEIPRLQWATEIDARGNSKIFNQEMGCIIQLLPEKKTSIYDAKYFYPEEVGWSKEKCDSWAMAEMDRVKDGVKIDGQRYVFDRILYWRLEKAHVCLIERDRDWFAKAYPLFEDIWRYVEFFRANPEYFQLWNRYRLSRKRIDNDNMMQVADKMLNDNKRQSYFKDLTNDLKDVKLVTVKSKRSSSFFNDSNMESWIQNEDDVSSGTDED
jgi:putative phage-type endonuclease